MDLRVFPGHPLIGEISLPGDKSICHRAILLAAIAGGDSILQNFLFAGVTAVMLNALAQMGLKYEKDGTTLIIHGKGPEGLHSSPQPIDCGNSATTIRLLAGFLSALGISAVLDGSQGLRKRPMKRILEPLISMGVPICGSEGGTAPLYLQSRPARKKLKPIDYILPVASAQVKSTLLFAALAAEDMTRITEPGPSRDHTELMLNSVGIPVRSGEVDNLAGSRAIEIRPVDALSIAPLNMKIPGDFSSAAFLMVGGLISPGSKIGLQDVGLNPTRTGLLDALQNMGADIQVTAGNSVQNEKTGNLQIESALMHETQIMGPLVVRMIDEFPIFTTAAIFSSGKTVVSEADELRYKESDRIKYLVQEFCSLGALIEEKPDGYIIDGQMGLNGGKVQSHGDHRLAMALAISGLATRGPMTINGAEMISESFPGFLDALTQLGASVKIEEV
jgi:3-phosphoshikimate 1-carboxyvinyltransferase